MQKDKRLRTALMIGGGGVLLAILTVVLLSVFLKDTPEEPPQNDNEPIRFYAPYDGDIRTAPLYTDLDRQFYYCDANYGTKEAMSREETDANPEWKALRAYFDCLINGDPEGLRSMLASDADGITVPDFAQQMVYQAEVTRVGEENAGGVLRVTYRLEYRIHRNNGTYRRDVGSDAVRPEYLTLKQDKTGEFRIADIRR